MRRNAALVVSAALVALAVLAAPAAAQEGEETTTTTAEPTTTTSTLLPPLLPSTTTTTQPPDPDDPARDGDVGPQEVPVVDATVPPRPGETAAEAAQLIRGDLEVANADLFAAEAGLQQARETHAGLSRRLKRLRRSLQTLGAAKKEAIERATRARELFEDRAADALIRGDMGDIENVFSAQNPNELGQRNAVISAVLDADDRAVKDYLAARAALDVRLRDTADELASTAKQLKVAREVLDEAERAHAHARVNVAVFAAGSEILISGFVFPVDEPHTFGDSWGAPRMPGTEYEHSHQGTDIMAPFDTELYACERGIITRMGTDVLGGISLWVKGESGTYYYYAHLKSYAEGIEDGTLVEAGDVVGYVGDTGNAKGGSPHLHFEIHPDGGAAVNPYPLLRVIDNLRKLSEQAAAEEQTG